MFIFGLRKVLYKLFKMNSLSGKTVELPQDLLDECDIDEETLSVGNINTPKIFGDFNNTLRDNKGHVKTKDLETLRNVSEGNLCETFKYKSHKNILDKDPIMPYRKNRTLSEDKTNYQFKNNKE